jgi:hypothetical protein
VKLCSINARILNVFKAFDERKAQFHPWEHIPQINFWGSFTRNNYTKSLCFRYGSPEAVYGFIDHVQ